MFAAIASTPKLDSPDGTHIAAMLDGLLDGVRHAACAACPRQAEHLNQLSSNAKGGRFIAQQIETALFRLPVELAGIVDKVVISLAGNEQFLRAESADELDDGDSLASCAVIPGDVVVEAAAKAAAAAPPPSIPNTAQTPAVPSEPEAAADNGEQT